MWFLRFEISANQKSLPFAVVAIIHFQMDWKSHEMLRTISAKFCSPFGSVISGTDSSRVFLSVSKSADYRLFISIFLLEIQLSRGERWDPINWFNRATLFVPVPSQDLNFQRHFVVYFFFMFNELKWEVIVRFVDIGGNVDHHCLNFLFIKSKMFM